MDNLKSGMAERKAIEREGRLVAGYGMDEAQAYSWLQREAMNRRMSMAQVAAVVNAESECRSPSRRHRRSEAPWSAGTGKSDTPPLFTTLKHAGHYLVSNRYPRRIDPL